MALLLGKTITDEALWLVTAAFMSGAFIVAWRARSHSLAGDKPIRPRTLSRGRWNRVG